MVVYLIEFRVCGKQYNGSTVIFVKNKDCQIKPVIRNVFTNIICRMTITGFVITIIDHAETVKSLRQKELYWYHKLKTCTPFCLNERDVYGAY